jgi:23S rRNA (guanosine2251-2'-O)-methyltransferase
MDKHPRDRFLTVVGRKPVLEALEQKGHVFGELLIDRGLRKETTQDILDAARRADVKTVFCDIKKVNRRSRSPKQDQGVALDIETPNVAQLGDWTRLNKDGVLFMPQRVLAPWYSQSVIPQGSVPS